MNHPISDAVDPFPPGTGGPARAFVLGLGAAGIANLEGKFKQGIAEGIDHPIVVVLDTGDPVARAMAEALLGAEHVAERVAALAVEDPPVAAVVWLVAGEAAIASMLRPHARLIADTLHMDRSDRKFRVVAASGHCISHWTHPSPYGAESWRDRAVSPN